jgi:hypothetical protein
VRVREQRSSGLCTYELCMLSQMRGSGGLAGIHGVSACERMHMLCLCILKERRGERAPQVKKKENKEMKLVELSPGRRDRRDATRERRDAMSLLLGRGSTHDGERAAARPSGSGEGKAARIERAGAAVEGAADRGGQGGGTPAAWRSQAEPVGAAIKQRQ